MDGHAAREVVKFLLAALHPARGAWLVVAGCLAATAAMAVLARDADLREDHSRFILEAERFLSAFNHVVTLELANLERVGRLTADAGSILDAKLAGQPQSQAVERAGRPGDFGFAPSADHTHLVVALNVAEAGRPDHSVGHLLAEMPVARLVEGARRMSGLMDEAITVDLPGAPAAPERLVPPRAVEREIDIRKGVWRILIRPAAQPPAWWKGRLTPLVLAVGIGIALVAGAVVTLLVRGVEAVRRARHAERELAGALRRVESDARTAWRMLKDEQVIDGFALWDEEARLVDFSGFLGRYLPQLSVWERPSARQVVEALVMGGHVVLPEGKSRDDAIAEMCMMRRVVPGLRELSMRDGQIFMARTVDLGEGRQACVFTNVTELRTHEAERRASEALFRTVFESGPLMMALLDEAQRPVAINRAFSVGLGYSLDRFAQLGWAGILHPDEAPGESATPWAPVARRLLAADGKVLRGQVRFTPVRDGEGRREGRLLVTIEDLTSRWEAEERVRYQASLLDQVTNAVLSVDRWGRIVYANRAALALFAWTEEVMQGTPVDRLLGPGILSLLPREGGEMEAEGVTWSGARFPAHVGASRLMDDGGLPVGSVLVVTDLTQRRAMDMQLMHSARLATLGEMSASIAHEFNQCLHVIRLSSEALSLDLADGRVELDRIGKRASNILAQVDRLTEMVTQMRSISRRDTGTRKAFLPQAALDSAVRMVEPLLRGDSIALVREGMLGDAMVLGHPVRLEQVLINLLNNARDAINDRVARDGRKGGVVTLACSVGGGRVVIRVRDDGIGVPDPVAPLLFDPFVTTKDEERGCGLGLSISRGIVTEMGGSLTFRNLDRGAEFTIDLPGAGECAQDHVCASQPAGAPVSTDDGHAGTAEDEDLEGRRVLVVDDEALSVMMVAEFLERQGYGVDTAYDGLEALALIEQRVYDTVITDIRMPRMDGRELIRRLADLQPGTPVIVVTGHLKEGSQAELGDNVAAVLPKPFQLLDLRRHLHAAMAGTMEGADAPAGA